MDCVQPGRLGALEDAFAIFSMGPAAENPIVEEIASLVVEKLIHDRNDDWRRRGKRHDRFRHRCRKAKRKDS